MKTIAPTCLFCIAFILPSYSMNITKSIPKKLQELLTLFPNCLSGDDARYNQYSAPKESTKPFIVYAGKNYVHVNLVNPKTNNPAGHRELTKYLEEQALEIERKFTSKRLKSDSENLSSDPHAYVIINTRRPKHW